MPATILTPYNGIRYGGDLSMSEVPGTQIRKNEFDLDILNQKFMGHSDYLTAFLAANPKYSANAVYPTMNRTEYAVTTLEGSMVEIMMTYKGVLDGLLPTPIISNDSKLTTVKVTTDDASDGNVTLQYYSNITIYRYILATFTNGPIYTSVRSTSLDYDIISQDPADISGTPQYETNDVVTRFNCEQQGLWFTYEVQVERLIQPLDALSIAQ